MTETEIGAQLMLSAELVRGFSLGHVEYGLRKDIHATPLLVNAPFWREQDEPVLLRVTSLGCFLVYHCVQAAANRGKEGLCSVM